MSGLGSRGKDKAKGPNGVADLFQPTEQGGAITQTHLCADLQNSELPPVRKQFQFSAELAEQLRIYAFTHRRKEVDVVRDALERFFEANV